MDREHDDQLETTPEADGPLTSYLPPSYGGETEDEPPAPEPAAAGWVSLIALRVTLGRVPLWLLCGLVPLVLAAVVALPWLQWFQGVLDHSYAPGSQRAWLDVNFRTDHGDALAGLRDATGQTTSALAALMLLLGVFFAGGWLQVFLERTEGHSVSRFLVGGVRYFWRFLRVFLLVALLLVAGSYLIYGELWSEHVLERLFGLDGGKLEAAANERVARRLTWLQDGLFALWFAGVLTWADYVRTRLAFLQSRAVLWTGLATFFSILFRPITTLRPLVALLLIEALVVLGLGYLSAALNHGMAPDEGLGRVALLFVLGVVVILWRTVVRAARYHACVSVIRTIVEPLGVDDPWENTVGGPGGPRYPVGEEDFEITI